MKPICHIALTLMACLVLGCGRSERPPPANFDRYVPSPEVARAAIEAVLTSWQSGRSLEAVNHLAVTLVVTDNHRKKGQELADFEILGETPGNAKRCFAVRLRLRQPEEEQTVRYVVVGINPLLIFRHEDLEELGQWCPAGPADEEAGPEETAAEPESPPRASEAEEANESEPAGTSGARIKEE